MPASAHQHQYIPTNGIRLHVVQAGPQTGPLVILLHGFPEFWYGWRRQIDELAARGFWVWAPDQRGYNLSDRPQAVAAYRRDELAQDVIGLMDAAGRDQAYLVGHDWGAAVAWWLANKHPDRLKKQAILNVPHHQVFSRHLQASWAQKLKSWYMFFFQIPRLPDALIARGGFAGFAAGIQQDARPGAFTDADMIEYRRAWSQPGAMTAMINWYRAAALPGQNTPPDPRISVPTLMIWGAQDRYLAREMAQASIDLCDDGRLVMIEEATHWVQHEEAEQVNRLIGEFFGDES